MNGGGTGGPRGVARPRNKRIGAHRVLVDIGGSNVLERRIDRFGRHEELVGRGVRVGARVRVGPSVRVGALVNKRVAVAMAVCAVATLYDFCQNLWVEVLPIDKNY